MMDLAMQASPDQDLSAAKWASNSSDVPAIFQQKPLLLGFQPAPITYQNGDKLDRGFGDDMDSCGMLEP